jgi:hypothetical protein
MEASHKRNIFQWETVAHEKYNVESNGGRKFLLKEAAERGNYNVLMEDVDPKLYDAATEDFESSHHLFRNAFNGSFPWEVLKVGGFRKPPNIAFSWRHWGEFVGDYKGNKGEGQLVEMTGFILLSVTEEFKITGIKVYYNPEDFLKTLQGKNDENEKFFGCPVGKFAGKFDKK